MLLSFNKNYYDSFSKESYSFGILLSEILKTKMHFNKVIDIGSGTCDFIYGFTENTNASFIALDNHDEIINKKYLINGNKFIKIDITNKINLFQTFDICFCLEVLEHIDIKDCKNVIENIINHSEFIVFSSAHKGQGGLNHINEKDLDYWISFFSQKGLFCFDFIRNKIKNNKNIPYYYKYNTVIFIKQSNKYLCGKFKDYKIKKNNFKFNLLYSIRKFLIHKTHYKTVNLLVIIKYLVKKLSKLY